MLDIDQRSKLAIQFRMKTQKSALQSKQLVNFTQKSYQKYDSVKIVNLLSILEAHDLPAVSYA